MVEDDHSGFQTRAETGQAFRRSDKRGLRLGREPAGVMDSVLDRRTVLRITDTPGKKSRWPPRRTPQAWRGPARFFPRGVGNSENRPPVKDGVHHARRFSAESQSMETTRTAPAPSRQTCPISSLVRKPAPSSSTTAAACSPLVIPGVFQLKASKGEDEPRKSKKSSVLSSPSRKQQSASTFNRKNGQAQA